MHNADALALSSAALASMVVSLTNWTPAMQARHPWTVRMSWAHPNVTAVLGFPTYAAASAFLERQVQTDASLLEIELADSDGMQVRGTDLPYCRAIGPATPGIYAYDSESETFTPTSENPPALACQNGL